ncbi:MAG: lysine 5,6-aminomutase subunit alpha [Deltaproteobacteria bacterium]|nr:lysine 5,6-aminomutase subunit alpha [Deltaproteobacteria bacterium]
MLKIRYDRQIVAKSREYATQIAYDIYKRFIKGFSTDSIERTTLRFLGVEGSTSFGQPKVNAIVEKVKKDSDIKDGVLYAIAREMAVTGVDFYSATNIVFDGTLSTIPPSAESVEKAKGDIEKLAISKYNELIKRRKKREEFKRSFKPQKTPLRYLIVATGNIYDDVIQAKAAAEAGADIIAVIRSTAQSLLDYVPEGATTEGYGGTYATQENFRIMRSALDETSKRLGRYIYLTNYSSGLCMPEIAFLGAFEGLDILLNDAMYGILFRDINMRRTFCDQFFSRMICAISKIIINTGEDNYLTTSDAIEKAHTVLTSLFINEAFAKLAGMKSEYMGLGHAFEINPQVEDSFSLELAQALLIRRIFPRSPIKYMPPTKHMTGDPFYSNLLDAMFNFTSKITDQHIHLLGMMTEAMHNPLIMDRYESLKNVNYIFNAVSNFASQITIKRDSLINRRAEEVLLKAFELLKKVREEGLDKAISHGEFADIKRFPESGKGLDGVYRVGQNYFNPVFDILFKKTGGER